MDVVAGVAHKQVMIGSLFKKKLCFKGHEFRTKRLNDATRCIYWISNKLYIKKPESEQKYSAFR